MEYTSKIKAFWQQYKVTIYAALLAICTLPQGFFAYVPPSIDGSWIRGINLAIKSHLTFGTDFIFTFGPLGFLSTRNTLYVGTWPLVLFDAFILFGCFYFFRKLLSKSAGWFFIILFAFSYFNGNERSQLLFLFFILFSISALRKKVGNDFEVICAAISGVVVFFIKVNYGIFSLVLLPVIAVLLGLQSRRSCLLFIVTSGVVFLAICSMVYIDLRSYVVNSLDIISGYAEAMQLKLDLGHPPLLRALLLLGLFVVTLALYFRKLKDQGMIGFIDLFTGLLLSLFAFLLYKNAFTRNDIHNAYFFAAMPLFMVFVMFILDYGGSLWARIACVSAILASDNMITHRSPDEAMRFIINATVVPVQKYFQTFFVAQVEISDPQFLVPADKRKIIGDASIDIFPIDIYLMPINGFNYKPRPVSQSYSAYTRKLDSLNAHHFYQADRPAFAMFWNSAIDNRNPMWDESLTKAALYLNYEHVDNVFLRKDTAITSGDWGMFLLLKSRPGQAKLPKFEVLYERTVNLEDTVHISFPANDPVYMSVDVDYTYLGELKKILFQAALLDVTLFADSTYSQSAYYHAVKPIIAGPVLINKIVHDNRDFINFMHRTLEKNRDVTAFVFHGPSSDLKASLRLRFYKFSNY